MISKDLLNILACPDCKSEIHQKAETLICQNCHRVYPIKNGIPVMLIEESWIEEPEKEAPKQ